MKHLRLAASWFRKFCWVFCEISLPRRAPVQHLIRWREKDIKTKYHMKHQHIWKCKSNFSAKIYIKKTFKFSEILLVCLFVCLFLCLTRQTLNKEYGNMHCPEVLSEIRELPLSALWYESDFNFKELASNHRTREISVKYLSQGSNSANS